MAAPATPGDAGGYADATFRLDALDSDLVVLSADGASAAAQPGCDRRNCRRCAVVLRVGGADALPRSAVEVDFLFTAGGFGCYGVLEGAPADVPFAAEPDADGGRAAAAAAALLLGAAVTQCAERRACSARGAPWPVMNASWMRIGPGDAVRLRVDPATRTLETRVNGQLGWRAELGGVGAAALTPVFFLHHNGLCGDGITVRRVRRFVAAPRREPWVDVPVSIARGCRAESLVAMVVLRLPLITDRAEVDLVYRAGAHSVLRCAGGARWRRRRRRQRCENAYPYERRRRRRRRCGRAACVRRPRARVRRPLRLRRAREQAADARAGRTRAVRAVVARPGGSQADTSAQPSRPRVRSRRRRCCHGVPRPLSPMPAGRISESRRRGRRHGGAYERPERRRRRRCAGRGRACSACGRVRRAGRRGARERAGGRTV